MNNKTLLVTWLALCISFRSLAIMLDDAIILKNVTLSDHEFIALINDAYPEMARLTEPVKASPESKMISNEHSPSMKLFSKQHIEYDRTAVGILALKWVLSNDYDQFVKCQPEQRRLKRESFDALRTATFKLVEKGLLATLVTSLAINDLGKVISFVTSVENLVGAKEVDHDNVLLTALQKFPELVPSFGKLKVTDQEMIIKGMSAQFNLGQFVQAENLPANLKGLRNLNPDELHFHTLHILFDVAGAQGHVKSQGSLVLSEPTYQFFTMAGKALEMIPSLVDDQSLIAIYNKYLRVRCATLYANFPIITSRDHAIARLACMRRCETLDQFKQVQEVFARLPDDIQELFISELNKTGITDHGILLYYAPAVLTNACAAFKQNPSEGLTLGLHSLADILYQARANLKPTKTGVCTIDCAVLAEKIKNPEEFKQYVIELDIVGTNAQVVIHPAAPCLA